MQKLIVAVITVLVALAILAAISSSCATQRQAQATIEVARALDLTQMDESKLVRLAVQLVVPALLSRKMVYLNGELVPSESAPAAFPSTGTEGRA